LCAPSLILLALPAVLNQIAFDLLSTSRLVSEPAANESNSWHGDNMIWANFECGVTTGVARWPSCGQLQCHILHALPSQIAPDFHSQRHNKLCCIVTLWITFWLAMTSQK